MREELTLAIEEVRIRTANSGRLIPLLLDDVAVPGISIGAGRRLGDIHALEWRANSDRRLKALLASLDRLPLN
jgi:hypothetical protein